MTASEKLLIGKLSLQKVPLSFHSYTEIPGGNKPGKDEGSSSHDNVYLATKVIYDGFLLCNRMQTEGSLTIRACSGQLEAKV